MADGSEPRRQLRPEPLLARNIEEAGITHGFFTRTGGVSEGIYASLNCGRGSDDERRHVEENRGRAALTLKADPALLIGPRQVHSAKTVTVTKAWMPGEAPEADAIVTNVRGLAIAVLTADCAPVLMADAAAGVVAAAHAGWKGAKAGIVESAVQAMVALGAKPERIAAAAGPCISPAAYEVGPDFKAAFLESDPSTESYFLQPELGIRPHFNLSGFVIAKLIRSGVVNIQDVSNCTYADESLFFSHRRSVHRSEPDYGRQISAILIS